MVIPKRIKRMTTPQGFYQLWIAKVGQGMTHKQAYQALEEEFIELWGERRYSSFESFRISQRERIMNYQSQN